MVEIMLVLARLALSVAFGVMIDKMGYSLRDWQTGVMLAIFFTYGLARGMSGLHKGRTT